MKFIADAMLGKLSRWLRLMGYDVHYKSDFDDDEIIADAKERIILTRDRSLFERVEREGLAAIFIRAMDIKGQLSQLKNESGIELQDTPALSRCPLCNGEIEKIEKLRICKNCQKVYWVGAHWKNIGGLVKDVQDPKK